MASSPVKSTPGQGTVIARLLPPNQLVLPCLSFQYPLKLISTSRPGNKVLTVFVLSYGGGLVSGDGIDISVTVESGAVLCLLTQGSTKLFPLSSPLHHTRQSMTVHLQPNSTLLLIPDPLQPFAKSCFTQTQRFYLPYSTIPPPKNASAEAKEKFKQESERNASLIVLDWVMEGRSALGEHWDMDAFESRNEYFCPGRVYSRSKPTTVRIDTINTDDISKITTTIVDDTDKTKTPTSPPSPHRLLLRDVLLLHPSPLDTSPIDSPSPPPASSPPTSIRTRMDTFTVFATLVITGPSFHSLSTSLISLFSAEPRIGGRGFGGGRTYEEEGQERRGRGEELGVKWTVAEVRGFVMVKVAGGSVEGVRRFLRGLLTEGEAGREFVERFGEGVLLCLQG